MLRWRRFHERPFIQEVSEELAPRTALVPWQADIVSQAQTTVLEHESRPLAEAVGSREAMMRMIQGDLEPAARSAETLVANAEQAARESTIESQVIKVQEIAEILTFEGVRALPACRRR